MEGCPPRFPPASPKDPPRSTTKSTFLTLAFRVFNGS